MRTVSRTLSAVLVASIGIAVLAASYWWLNSRYTKGMAFAVQHKSVKHSSGKMLSVVALAPDDAAQRGPTKYNVCFSIESSSEIIDSERGEYQAALSRPFCRNSKNPAAAKLKPGDGLEIGYLLENEGQISVARIEASGQSIYP